VTVTTSEDESTLNTPINESFTICQLYVNCEVDKVLVLLNELKITTFTSDRVLLNNNLQTYHLLIKLHKSKHPKTPKYKNIVESQVVHKNNSSDTHRVTAINRPHFDPAVG
jgi:hypothetical protein